MIDFLILAFALLSLVALVGAADTVTVLAVPRLRAKAAASLGDFALPTAAVTAAVATLGSLFMSEAAGFVPCRLCWVQRGFMYPLAALLLAGLIWRWTWAWAAALPLAAGGAGVAFFHYGEQQGWFGGSEAFCDAAVPCTDIWVNEFGFITIPFMAFAGFAFIAALCVLHLAAVRNRRARDATPAP